LRSRDCSLSKQCGREEKKKGKVQVLATTFIAATLFLFEWSSLSSPSTSTSTSRRGEAGILGRGIERGEAIVEIFFAAIRLQRRERVEEKAGWSLQTRK